MWFSREIWDCIKGFVISLLNNKINKKERVISKFKMGFKKSFCWHSNLGNDDTISWRPGLNMGMDFRGLVWKRMWKNGIFWFVLRLGFGVSGSIPPLKIPRSAPTPRHELNLTCRKKFKKFCWNGWTTTQWRFSWKSAKTQLFYTKVLCLCKWAPQSPIEHFTVVGLVS